MSILMLVIYIYSSAMSMDKNMCVTADTFILQKYSECFNTISMVISKIVFVYLSQCLKRIEQNYYPYHGDISSRTISHE